MNSKLKAVAPYVVLFALGFCASQAAVAFMNHQPGMVVGPFGADTGAPPIDIAPLISLVVGLLFAGLKIGYERLSAPQQDLAKVIADAVEKALNNATWLHQQHVPKLVDKSAELLTNILQRLDALEKSKGATP